MDGWKHEGSVGPASVANENRQTRQIRKQKEAFHKSVMKHTYKEGKLEIRPSKKDFLLLTV